MSLLDIHLKQLELKYLEEYLKTHPAEPSARQRLDVLKAEFRALAQHAAVID